MQSTSYSFFQGHYFGTGLQCPCKEPQSSSAGSPPLGLAHNSCTASHWDTGNNSTCSTYIAFYIFRALKLISYRATVQTQAGCEKENCIQWKLQGESGEAQCNYPVWRLARAPLLGTLWDPQWPHAVRALTSHLAPKWWDPQRRVLRYQVQEGDHYKKSDFPPGCLTAACIWMGNGSLFQVRSPKPLNYFQLNQLLVILTNDPPCDSINRC